MPNASCRLRSFNRENADRDFREQIGQPRADYDFLDWIDELVVINGEAVKRINLYLQETDFDRTSVNPF